MNKQNPEMSVVMPVYNASGYLEEAISSVLSQSLDNFEFIIIDDGSDDNCVELISAYSDRRIKLVRNHHDFINSLNLGFEMAKGKYIVRMDADDIMSCDRLKCQFEFMEKHPEIDVSGTWMEVFGDNITPYIAKTVLSHDEIKALALLCNPLSNPTTIIRNRTCIRPFLLYEKSFVYAEDYRLWTKLLMNGFKFANQPAVLHKYRRSKDQVTSTKTDKMAESALLIRKEYVEYWINVLYDRNHLKDIIEVVTGSYFKEYINFETLSKLLYPLV